MAYEKYIKKDGKLYGPYIYKSVRKGDRVVTEYVGMGDTKEKKKINKKFLFIILLGIFGIAIILSLVFYNNSVIGKMIFDISPIYKINETISGNIQLNLKYGELIPADSLILVKLNNQERQIALSDIIDINRTSGNFYIDEKNIEGAGEGYGVLGRKIIYPEVSFVFRVVSSGLENNPEGEETETSQEETKTEESLTQEQEAENQIQEEQNAEPAESEQEQSQETTEQTEGNQEETNQEAVEQQQEASQEEQQEAQEIQQENQETTEQIQEQPQETAQESQQEEQVLTGGAVIEDDIQGSTSKDKQFSYSVGENNIEIISVDKGNIDDLKISKENGVVTINTDYSETEDGFGKEYLTEDTKTFEIDLEKFNIKAEDGKIESILIYNNESIISKSEEIKVSGIEALNITIENKTESNLTANLTGNITVETKKYKIVLNRPVKWHKKVFIENATNLNIELPKEAENISIKTGDEIHKAEESARAEEIQSEEDKQSLITGNVIGYKKGRFIFSGLLSWLKITGKATEPIVLETNESKIVEVNENQIQNNEVLVEYETPAPISVEEETASGKKVTISALTEMNYTDILSYAEIPELLNVGEGNKIKIYWEENKSLISFDAYDLDGNGKLDYVEWITPHLSNQTFEIILITKAEELDSNRSYLRNIYEFVKEKDNNFTLISSGNYLRVEFERNLTRSKDITIYARAVNITNESHECYDSETEIYTREDVECEERLEDGNEIKDSYNFQINSEEERIRHVAQWTEHLSDSGEDAGSKLLRKSRHAYADPRNGYIISNINNKNKETLRLRGNFNVKTNIFMNSKYINLSNSPEKCYKYSWKLFSELNGKEKVYTLNQETGEKEWQIPSKKQNYEHQGEMYNIETEEGDLLVSPEHKIYGKLEDTTKDKNTAMISRGFNGIDIQMSNLYYTIETHYLNLSDFLLIKISDVYDNLENKKLYFLNENLEEVEVKNISKIDYSGKIYDVDVDNDVVLVRRGGLITWSGNSNPNSASIEVYRENDNNIVAKFENISQEAWYKVYLTNLSEGESYSTFDLKMLGDVEFDYVVDPQANTTGNIVYQCGTLDTAGVYTMNQSISSTGTCISVNANNVEINCNSSSITGDGTGTGINATNSTGPGWSNLTVRNCIITGFGVGVDASGVSGTLADGSLGRGGNINIINSNASIVNSYGGVASCGSCGVGGSGGSVIIINSSLTTINAYGGNSSDTIAGAGGSGGGVNATDSVVNDTINSYGGSTIANVGGGAGSVNLIRSSVNKITSYGGSSTGGGGSGATITITNSLVNLTNSIINVSRGTGSPNGVAGTLTLNFSSSFSDTSTTYSNMTLRIINSTGGEIRFLKELQGGILNLSSNIRIGNNSAFVNSTSSSILNQSANITLYGLSSSLINPYIARDNVICNSTTSPSCNNFTALTGTAVFNVSSWTTYSILDSTSVSLCGVLSSANTKYSMINNLIPLSSPCINITAQNITLDCGGFFISNTTTEAGITGIYSNQINTTIKNCNITMVAFDPGYGIHLLRANNSYIYNNTIDSNYDGIYADGIYYSTINGNFISNNGHAGLYGVTGGIANSNISSNNFSANNIGLWLYNSGSGNNVYNNSFSSNTNTGMIIQGSHNNNASSNRFNANARDIQIEISNNNILENNILLACTPLSWGCLYIAGNNNTISGGIINGSSQELISLVGNSPNNMIRDLILLGSTTNDVRLTGSANNTFLNVTYNLSRETLDATSSLTRKWYYRAYANDTLGRNVSNANVTAYNVSNAHNFNFTTDATGYTILGEIVDYVNTGGTRAYYSNYTIFATNSSYNPATLNHSFNSSLGNNYQDVFTFGGDTISPVISLIIPANNTSSNNRTQIFSCNITDETSILNLTLYIWNSTGSLNYTNTTALTGTSNLTNWTYTLPYDNSFLWNCLGYDTSGNSNYSIQGNFTLTIDTLAPNVNITYPLNTTYNINVSAINYTSTGTSCWWSNSSGLWNSSIVTAGTNWTGLISIEGSNTWIVYCNDSANNLNSSSVTFFKDTIFPLINFTNPAETSSIILSRNNIAVNISVTETNLQNITIYLFNSTRNQINSTNSTLSPLFVNFTGLADGIYYFNATSYDTAGNNNFTETRNVTIDATKPIISLISPADGITSTGDPWEFLFNVSDITSTNCSLILDGSIANSSSSVNIAGGTISLSRTVTIDSHSWRINCTDSANNIQNSSTRTFIRRASGGGGTACTDTCSSSGYECGVQSICSTSTNCGSCSSGKTCSSGKCINATSCIENWACGNWSLCENNINARTCNDLNNCGTSLLKPITEKNCSETYIDGNEITGDGNEKNEKECGNWSLCETDYSLNDLIIENKNIKDITGKQIRECLFQENRTIETKECGVKMDLTSRRTEWCEENYTEVYDSSGNLFSRIKESEEHAEVKDISFTIMNYSKYCDYCFDGKKNYDEEDVDCGGGNCAPCRQYVLKRKITYREISLFLLGLMFLLIILLVILCRERRKKKMKEHEKKIVKRHLHKK